MRVLLQPDVFTADHHLALMVLLWLGSVGRHRVIPHPDRAPSYLAWLAALDPATARAWTSMVNGSLDREVTKPAHWELVLAATRDAAWQRPTPTIPIGEAVDLLLQPYRIVLENNVNDRAFLLALCGRDEAGTLAEAERRAWLVFEMGGGSAVVPRVHEIRRTEALRRMASVLVDSDAMRAPKRRADGTQESHEDVEGDQARQVRRAAGDALLGVHLHVLRRRAIESYLPSAALRRHLGADDRIVAALDRLSPAQRHHFNMKGGFDKDAPNAARADGLYDSLHPRVRERLREGFGVDIAKLFTRSVRVDDVDEDARDEVGAFVTQILARMR